MNWNAENDGIQEYNYETMPGKDPKTGTDMKHGYTNSYGWNVMRGMADRLIEITKKQQDEGGVKSDEEAAALEKHSACGSWSGRYYWRRAAGCQFCKGNRAFLWNQ